MARITSVDVTIPAGQSLSNPVDCTAGATNAYSIIMPDDWVISGGLTLQAAELPVSARSTIGSVTFDSSAAVGLIAVTTSSGFIGWIPFYPSS